MKTLVAYYSRKGSNDFLARRIAEDLGADIEPIVPRAKAFIFIMLNINFGIRPLKSRLGDYDRVVMVGPIFMGRFIPPLKSFVSRYGSSIRELLFVTCCGSTYKQKDEKFGHGLVFEQVREIMGEKLSHCQAFPIGLVLPEEQKEDTDAFMKTHLTADNFKGDIVEIYDGFIGRISA